MDTEVLVDKRTCDGERLIKALAAKGIEIASAFWLKMSEDGQWVLYLALPSVGAKGLASAYSDVYAVLAVTEGIWIDMAEIKLISIDDPIALHVNALRGRLRGQNSLQLKAHRFVNLEAEEVYIYPALSLPGRRTRVFAVREEVAEGQSREVREEIGIIPGIPGEATFTSGWLDLMNVKYGGVNELAKKYKGVALQFIE